MGLTAQLTTGYTAVTVQVNPRSGEGKARKSLDNMLLPPPLRRSTGPVDEFVG